MAKTRKTVPQTYYYSRANQTNNRRPPRPARRHHRLVRDCLILVILIGIVSYFIFFDSNNKLADLPLVRSVVKTTQKPKAPEGLSVATLGNMDQQINAIINANSGIDISVNLIDLNGGQSEHYGSDDTFQAASTAKILTAEYFLHQVEDGQESLSETINGSSAEYELQQMIVVSDDNAWAALNNELGYTNLQNYADSVLGISDYQAYNNSLSSVDIALALQKLWNGSLLNQSDTQLLLSYLQQANYREYIVPAVPAGDTIYHKIGLYEDYVNDAAIITHGSQAFVIVIFTNGNGAYNWPARATMMQSITKVALASYFNQI